MFSQKKLIKGSLLGLSTLVSLSLTQLINADTYTVKSGDTLSSIANSHNLTIDKLAQLNNIRDVNVISIGQDLLLTTSKDTTNSDETASSTSTLSQADQAAKEEIAQRESGGNYTAQNGQYYGRYQLTLSYLNGDLSPENQEKVADAYVNERYGSWSAALAFWNANGWY